MAHRFDPRRYRGRVIVIDCDAGTEKMNCLKCGRLAEELYRGDELCRRCYGEWSKRFAKRWVKERFPARPRTQGNQF